MRQLISIIPTEGMDPDELATAAYEAFLAATGQIAKHTPGGIPHDQSAHGDWSAGSGVGDGKLSEWALSDVERVAASFKIDLETPQFAYLRDSGVDLDRYISEGGVLADLMGTKEEFLDDVRRHGIMKPLAVARDLDGKLKLYDGYHRLWAAQQLGIETLPVVVFDVDEYHIEKHTPGGIPHDQSLHGDWSSGSVAIPAAPTAVIPATETEGRTPEGLADPRYLAAEELAQQPVRPGIDDNPEIVALADQRWEAALQREAEVTPALMAISDQTGGQMQGLNFRVKTPYSIRDKIIRTMEEHGYESLEEATAAVGDVNRYTMAWDPDANWNGNVQTTIAALEERGWRVTSFKNAFLTDDDFYDGINTKISNGVDTIELQFHTYESFEIKEKIHPWYKEYRAEGTTLDRRAELGDQMNAAWAAGTHRPVEYTALEASMFVKRRILKESVPYPDFYSGPNNSMFRVLTDGHTVERLDRSDQWVASSLTVPELQGLGGDVYQPISDKDAMTVLTKRRTLKPSNRTRIAKFDTPVQVAKTDDYKNLVFGWASVNVTADGSQVIDHQGHAIDVEDLESAAYDFVVKDYGSGDMHSGEGFGELVESMVFTKEKMDLLGIENIQEGWWVGFRVPPEQHKRVRSGERKMFSIEGTAKLQPFGE